LKKAAAEEHAAGVDQATAGWVVLGIGGGVTIAGLILAIAAGDQAPQLPQAMLLPWISDPAMGTTIAGRW